MKLTPRKNNYGHSVIDCPFCDDFIYLRESRLHQPDRLTNLKRHITNQSRNEALELCIANSSGKLSEKGKHLEYFLAHTTDVMVKVQKKRGYDDDLTI